MPILARRDALALAATTLTAYPLATVSAEPLARPRAIAPVRIRNVAIGEGATKTIVSIAEATPDRALTRARLLGGMADVDVVEYRLDHLDDLNAAAIAATVRPVAQAIAGKPLVVTFRTKDEGGEKAIAPSAYAALYHAVLASDAGDLLDIQTALLAHSAVAAVKARAQAGGRKVILSHHDFVKTPTVDAMIAILRRQQALGADICKLAVMPHDPADVLRLLGATWTRRCETDRPLIAMAMGGVGAVSRLAGEAFGSAVSFGSVGASSAPGQVQVADLHATLGTVHRALVA